jgi:hypothetical protein
MFRPRLSFAWVGMVSALIGCAVGDWSLSLAAGNQMELGLARIVSGVLANATFSTPYGRGANCAQHVLEKVDRVDRMYNDARANARLVAMLVHACGGLEGALSEGTPPPGMSHDGGITAARSRMSQALQSSLDHEVAPHWPRTCARLDAQSPHFSWSTFAQQHIQRGVPVVIAGLGAAEFGEGVETWRDLRHLRARFGATRHETSIFDSSDTSERLGIFPRNASDAAAAAEDTWVNKGELLRLPRKELRSLADLLDLAQLLASHSWFVEQSELWGLASTADGFTDTSVPPTASFPEMWRELGEPTFATQCQLQSVNVWLGALDPHGVHKAKESALHFDKDDGFLYQLTGQKNWTFFHRYDAQNLYMRWWHTMYDGDVTGAKTEHQKVVSGSHDVRNLVNNFSPVCPHAPDLARFPRFARARPMACSTAPGDVIFVPAFTWHHVNSTHEPGGINSALNYWTLCQSSGFDMLMELMHDQLRQGEWEKQHGNLPPFMTVTLGKHPHLRTGTAPADERVGDEDEDEDRTTIEDEL